MELIMGPTCSIFFEKEPVEGNIMFQRPREKSVGLFTRKEMLLRVVQGMVIATGALVLYYYFMHQGASLKETRTIVFTTLIISNIFLTYANRSFSETILETSRYKNKLAPVIILASVLFIVLLQSVPLIRALFRLEVLSANQILTCIGVAFVSVMWFELYKAVFVKKIKSGFMQADFATEKKRKEYISTIG
jgi:Ca2+-transporting ATPase